MFSFLKSKLQSVADGTLMDIIDVPDAVFSAKMLGDGYAIAAHDGKVYAPAKGTIRDIFPSKHSMTLVMTGGQSVLIHMGLDTVELNGEGFTLHVKQGDSVKAGDLVAEMDLNVLKQHGKDSIVIVALPEAKAKLCTKPGAVDRNTAVLTIEG